MIHPLIAPGRTYRVAGPGGEWVVTGLSTAGETATVHLVTATEAERLRRVREDLDWVILRQRQRRQRPTSAMAAEEEGSGS